MVAAVMAPVYRVCVNPEEDNKLLERSGSLDHWYGWLRRLDMDAFNNRSVRRTVNYRVGNSQARINFPDAKVLVVELADHRNLRGEVIWQGAYADVIINPDHPDTPVHVDGVFGDENRVVLYAIYEAFAKKWRY